MPDHLFGCSKKDNNETMYIFKTNLNCKMKKFKQFEVGFEANQNLILWITFVL